MDDKYLLSTWTAPCPCGRTHRIVILADNDGADDDAFGLYIDNLTRGIRVGGLVQRTVDRELVDGFFHEEYQP